MLADVESVAKETFGEASSVLGYDLWNLIANGPEDQLNQTEYTQPALLTCSIALYRLALAKGLPVPDVVAGHSLGEYSALVAAEVLQFSDAVSLVQQRGRFMQSAVPIGEGGMAAIMGLSDEEVRAACAEAAGDEIVQAANYNAPGQVVIAGSTAAVERGIDACKAAGAKRAMSLPVSAPFHSALMQQRPIKWQANWSRLIFPYLFCRLFKMLMRLFTTIRRPSSRISSIKSVARYFGLIRSRP